MGMERHGLGDFYTLPTEKLYKDMNGVFKGATIESGTPGMYVPTGDKESPFEDEDGTRYLLFTTKNGTGRTEEIKKADVKDVFNPENKYSFALMPKDMEGLLAELRGIKASIK